MILELLGASKGFLTSSAILVSIPAVFYQASNTKNDIQVGFFLLCLIWLTEVAVKKRTVSWPISILTGIVVGFCLMAKGTSLIYLTVLLPILLYRLFANRVSLHFAPILSTVLISIAIASPHYIPHTKNILAGDTGEKSEHKNAKINIQNAVSVLSKNVALQMALPWPSWNTAVKNGVERLHHRLGVGVNSPETSFYDQPFDVIYWPNSEDNVTSILAILIIVLLPFICIYQIFKGKKFVAIYYFLPSLLLLLFSILLKWQPWHTRLLIPIEIIAGIPIGIVMASGISVLAKFFSLCFQLGGFFRA
jgi:4-amino-4-deoxy-L-arabinose transferase-like glycosyltransferase